MDLNKKLEELKPYQLNCNVFDVYSYNGLTMQDLLCQFFTKINECITVSNETIDLAKWLVNEGLEIEVVKKLMIWLEDGTLENIINVNLFNTLNEKINGLNSQLEHKANEIKIYPGFSQSKIQEIFDTEIEGILKIIFTEGVYNLDTIRIKSNTHILLNKAIINTNSKHLFYNFKTDDTFTEYNGNGNIIIEGGVVNGHLISMIHAKDVNIKNVTLKNTINDHYLEICGCNNVVIDNCNIEGVLKQSCERNYVECIQLDTCEFSSFPWFNSESVMFDNTPNKNITIKNCKFENNSSSHELYVAIGSHVIDFDKIQENIIIENCVFNNVTNRAISVMGWTNVKIHGCIFEDCSLGLLFDSYAKTIEVSKNQFKRNNECITSINGGGYSVNLTYNVFEYTKSNICTFNDIINLQFDNNYLYRNVGRIILNKSRAVIISNNSFSNNILKEFNHVIFIKGDVAYSYYITIENNFFGDYVTSESQEFDNTCFINLDEDYTFQIKQFNNNIGASYTYVIRYNNERPRLYAVNKFDDVQLNSSHNVTENDSYIDENNKLFLNTKIVLTSEISGNVWTKIADFNYNITGEKVIMCSIANFTPCVCILNNQGINIKTKESLGIGEQIRLISNFTIL